VVQNSTNDEKTRKLADGNSMPMLGLGVWQVENNRDAVDAVRWALEAGYRHIDTAQAYGNEESVGQGLRESGVPRDEVFITTKFFPGRQDPVAEAELSLKRLGVDYVDLYLVHWPEGGPTRAWPGMERTRAAGFARSIGVSNFGVDDLTKVLAISTDQPVVNQVQFSPHEFRKSLLDSCDQNGIALEAYSPLGTGRHLASDTVTRIANAHGRTPAQVLLRWCVQQNIPVIPKSIHHERIVENAQIFDFHLNDEDIAELDALDHTGGTDRALERRWWR
jgi:diketogulonate reductase-like aldo/keto reductase